MGPQVIIVIIFLLYLVFGVFTMIFSMTIKNSEYATLKQSKEFLPLLYHGHGVFFPIALIIICWGTAIYWLAINIVTQIAPNSTFLARFM